MKTGVEILTSPIFAGVEGVLLVLFLWAVARHPEWAGVRPTAIVFLLWLLAGIGISAYSVHEISGKSHRLYRAQNPREYERRWIILSFRVVALVFLVIVLTHTHSHAPPQPPAEETLTIIQDGSSPPGM